MRRPAVYLASSVTLISLCGCQALQRLSNWGTSFTSPHTTPTKGAEAILSTPPTLLEPAKSPLNPLSQSSQTGCRKELDMPKELVATAHYSNYGERLKKDRWGRTLAGNPRIIVLHETALGTTDTIRLFQTAHPRDEDQVSYHLIIDRDGSIHRIVPDAKRAYGAGMSAFGDVTQRSKPGAVGSINNIALHISLSSPNDGLNDKDSHSGYTEMQYKRLASQVLLWQGAYGIPLTRVTTHAAVDRSHSRYDPRSFRWDQFDKHYREAASRCGWQHLDNQQAGV